MGITAQQVNELRKKTGAGMMDCKKALSEANGDFDKAIEILRKKGASVAAKRAEKSASEGLVLTKQLDQGKSAIMLEVKCETDFVAKSDDFVNFADLVLRMIEEKNPADVDELLSLEKEGKKISESLSDMMGKIGEKIEIARFVWEDSSEGLIADYVHSGSKLGVLVRSDDVSDKREEFTSILKDISMQVAAMKPLYLFREEVPKEIIDKEIEIYKEVARKEGKPEQVLEKIAQGKINKYYEENCLYEQMFIKDNSRSVGSLIEEFNKANGTSVKLKLFHRFHISDDAG